MKIGVEFLEQKIAEMQITVSTYNGAIQFAEYLLSELENPVSDGMPIADFAKAVAGDGATAEIQPIEK